MFTGRSYECRNQSSFPRFCEMEKVDAPRSSSSDRSLESQEALESQIHELIDEAMLAGWGKAETLFALVDVAENIALEMGADKEHAELLATVKRMKD